MSTVTAAFSVATLAFVLVHVALGGLALLGVRWAIRAFHRPAPAEGATIRWTALYDVLVGMLSFGRERAFRERILQRAVLQPGEDVLDVGCGTGTLALLAKRAVGDTGAVHGVDFSAPMIRRATHKATNARLNVRFSQVPAQRLPVDSESVEVVLVTLVMHHLPKADRRAALLEMYRVLRPNGRILIVDLGAPTGAWALLDPISLVHGRQGLTTTEEAAALLCETGFAEVHWAPLGARALAVAHGTKPPINASSTPPSPA